MSTRNRSGRKKRRSKRGRILLLLIIILTIAVFFHFRKQKIERKGFKVQKVVIEGCENVKAEEFLASSGIKKEMVIKDVDKEKIMKRMKNNRWVKDVLLTECAFGTLVIEITERKPIAILKNDRLSLLCSDGTIIPYSKEFSDLPHVYISDRRDPSLFISRIVKIEEVYGSMSVTIYFKDKERTVVIADGFKILIGSSEPLPLKTELYNVVKEMKSNGYTICDMRFKNQIIFEKGGVL